MTDTTPMRERLARASFQAFMRRMGDEETSYDRMTPSSREAWDEAVDAMLAEFESPNYTVLRALEAKMSPDERNADGSGIPLAGRLLYAMVKAIRGGA